MQRKRWRQARRGIYGTLLASGKGVLFLEGCKDGIWWLGGGNAARADGNGTGGVEAYMGHRLRRIRAFYFLKGARMGYGGSEEKMVQDRMEMGHVHEALKAFGDCGQGT